MVTAVYGGQYTIIQQKNILVTPLKLKQFTENLSNITGSKTILLGVLTKTILTNIKLVDRREVSMYENYELYKFQRCF